MKNTKNTNNHKNVHNMNLCGNVLIKKRIMIDGILGNSNNNED